MKSRLFVLLWVSLFLALGVTAACSSGDGDSDEQSSPTAAETAAEGNGPVNAQPAPEAPAETTEPRDDDDELTLEDYFQQVDELEDDFNARIGALEGQFPGLTPREVFAGAGTAQLIILSGELGPAVITDLLSAAGPIFGDFMADFADIQPPPAAVEDHNEALAAGEAFEEAREVVVESIQQSQFRNEFLIELGLAGGRFNDACIALEELASGSGIVVDLGCPR